MHECATPTPVADTFHMFKGSCLQLGNFLHHGVLWLLAIMAMHYLHGQRQYANEHQLLGATSGESDLVLRFCLWASHRATVKTGC